MIDVSCLIICFNKEQYLNDCIASIGRQTKEPQEIIIVHDGCKDVGVHLGADNIVLKNNRGVSQARHEAFRFSSSKLILFIDGDDVLDPDYLEKMTLAIADGADIAYPDLYLWAKDSKLVVTPNAITPGFVKDHEKVVIPVTCLMKREVYEKIGGFRELPVLEDLDFWIRAMALGFKFKKAQTLLWYRRYEGTRNSMPLEARKRVLTQILNQFEIKKEGIKLK